MNGPEVNVHYNGWRKEFDEWRPLADIVSRSADSQRSDAIALLRHVLAVKIKENLNLSRVHDSEIVIHIPVQSDTFEEFARVANVQKEEDGARPVQRCSVKDIGKFLESNW